MYRSSLTRQTLFGDCIHPPRVGCIISSGPSGAFAGITDPGYKTSRGATL